MKQKTSKIKIGILGENPENDAVAFRTLLNKRVYPNAQFTIPIRNVAGGQLDNVDSVVRRLKLELDNDEDLQNIIVVRDLDDTISNIDRLAYRELIFNEINNKINTQGIFYLAVAEIEALLLADIETINKYFKLKLQKYPNPMSVKDPKNELRIKTAKSKSIYEPNLCNKIMEKISFDEVYKNHNQGEYSFKTFIDKLDSLLNFKKS